MWTCPNCGTENVSEARFCVGCGQPKPEAPTVYAGEQEWQPSLQPQQAHSWQEPEPRRPIWPWALTLGALLLAAVVLVILLVRRNSRPVDLDEETPTPAPIVIEEVTPEPDPGPSDPPVIDELVTPTPAPTPKPTPKPSPTPVPAGENLSLYLPVAENAKEESKDFSQWSGTFAGGILYDVDGDGQRELILLYPGYVGEYNAEAVYSVYTLRDGKAVNVIPRTGMGGLAVSPAFFAGVVRLEGENYLIFTMTNGDQQTVVEGHTLYRAKDYSLAYELHWTESKDAGAVTCSINGESCTREEYDRFLGGLEKLAYAGSLQYGATEEDAAALVKGAECYGLVGMNIATGKDFKLFHGDVMEWEALLALLRVAPGQPGDEDAVIVTDAAQVGDAGLRQLCNTMDGVIAENVRSSWGKVEHLTGSTYVGYYLLAAKDENGKPQNMLILVYRNDVSIRIPEEKIEKNLSYYYSLRFENVKIRPDGSLVLDQCEKPSDRVNANIPKHNYYYNGHETLNGVYKAWVQSFTGSYTVTKAGDLP